jgi:hypothetical protein
MATGEPTPNPPQYNNMPYQSDAFLPMSGEQSVKKSVEDMKEFMSKDVVELAAGEPQGSETLDVRGRKLVLPTMKDKRRDAIFVACLYALENQNVDKILRALDVKGYFRAEDGSTELRPFMEGHGAKPLEKHEPKKLRNILIGDQPAKSDEVAGQMVAVYLTDGGLRCIGAACSWDKMSSDSLQPTHCTVRALNGDMILAPVGLIKLLSSPDDLVKALSGALQK